MEATPTTGAQALVCRSCGASLDAGRLDRRLSVVTCSHCGTLHEMPRAEAGDGRGRAAARPERAPVPLPERFEVSRPGGGLHVRWPEGRKSGAFALAFFALFWGGVTLSAALWFLTPLSLVFLYMAAVRAVNRRELKVDGAAVSIAHGPLPWKGSKRLESADVRQLFVTEHVSRVREGGDRGDGTRTREVRSYRVSAVLEGERTERLLGGLGSPGQALWLEQEIERAHGIEDRAVGGEYGR